MGCREKVETSVMFPNHTELVNEPRTVHAASMQLSRRELSRESTCTSEAAPRVIDITNALTISDSINFISKAQECQSA